MLFNSFEFLVFFAIVASLYWRLERTNQNRLLLMASAVFYGSWDLRFLALMYTTMLVDYTASVLIDRSTSERRRRAFLAVSVVLNLAMLAAFKYYGFFVATLSAWLAHFGVERQFQVFDVLLPVGISFYTLQSIGYVIDVYRREVAPPKSFFDFALFVTFFPQLVAGPIERFKHLASQFELPRRLKAEHLRRGAFYVIYGLWLKTFVADNVGLLANPVFSGGRELVAPAVSIGMYAFTFQIYGDFAGYSVMAKGLALLLGFNVSTNFCLPLWATSFVDLWRRWHASLSSWLTSYLFRPLGGSRGGVVKMCRNLIIVMCVCGLWHGPNWTFVVWGLFHGVLLCLNQLATSNVRVRAFLERTPTLAKRLFVFHTIVFAGVMFRSPSVDSMFTILSGLGDWDGSWLAHASDFKRLAFYVVPVIAIEAFQVRHNELEAPLHLGAPLKAAFFVAMLYSILVFGFNDAQSFIYFQF